MNETTETCRRLYNDFLDDRIKNQTGFLEQKRNLTRRRAQDKYLRNVYSQVLQDVALRLDKAFNAFFSGISEFPKFKRKNRFKSFTYPQFGFRIYSNHIRFSLIGTVRAKLHRPITGVAKRITIIKRVDQWYALITTKIVVMEKSAIQGRTTTSVGVDFGVNSIVSLSDGTTIPAPKFLRKSEAEIRKAQKSFSRKKLGSQRQAKSKIKLGKVWRRVTNRRDDFAHKLSHLLTSKYDLVVFENIEIPNLTRNHSLASAILDAGWGKLRLLTAYKAERRGGRVILVDPSGTSQECSGCRKVVPKDLKDRIHSCPSCGLCLDRDINAARNILARGLERASVETKPLLSQSDRKRVSMFSQRSEKL
jgi:putative transposase